MVATQILSDYYATSPERFADALWIWINEHVIIVDEFEELLISPSRMIEQIYRTGRAYGDCDDIAMLSASILASLGADTQLVALLPQNDGTYAHVICRYRFTKMPGFVDFDGTVPQRNLSYPEDVLIESIVS